MTLPMYQLGWMAGILDLKGVILRKKNRQRATTQLVLAVETKQIGIIRELGRMTGTTPELQKARKMEPWMRRGCTEHCPEQHVHGYPQDGGMPAIGRWTITGAAMVVVLSNVMPYIRNDDKGFAEAMQEALGDVVLTGQGRGAIDRALDRLRELGWDVPMAVMPPLEMVGEKDG